MLELPEKIDQTYDMILLSNIPDYISDIFFGDSRGSLTYNQTDNRLAVNKYIKFVKNGLYTILNPSGEIIATSFLSSGSTDHLTDIGFYSEMIGDVEQQARIYTHKRK